MEVRRLALLSSQRQRVRRARIGLRGCIVVLLSAQAVVFVSGCAEVNPQPDFDAAAERIQDRLDVDAVYDPTTEKLVEDKVRSMLADGVTVDEAVRIALLNNRGFQAMFQTIGASRADVVQSGLLTNPSIGLSARFPEGGGRSNLSVSFAQEIADLWRIPIRKKIAEAQLEQTINRVVHRAVELAAAARTAYYKLAIIQQREAIARENLDLVRKSIDIAEARLRGGEAGEIDVNLLRAASVDVRASLLKLARDRDVATADLGRIMGIGRWDAKWRIADSTPDVTNAISDDQSLVIFAMKQRLDARIAEFKVKAAEGELKRQELSVFSSVQVGLEAERSEQRALPGRKIASDTLRSSIRQGQLTAPDIQTRGERNIDRAQIIDVILGPSIQLTLPIWDQNQAQIAKAAFALQSSRKDFEDTLDQIANEVQRASAVVRTSASLMRFYEETAMPTANRNLELARKAYEGGEQNVLAVIKAQEFLMTQRQTAAEIKGNYLSAMAELQRALGGQLPAGNIPHSPTTRPAAAIAAPETNG